MPSAFSLNAAGVFTYTPAPGFVGTVSFQYQANDGTWAGPPSAPMSPDSNVATVTIVVADRTPPVVTLTIPSPGASGVFVKSPVAVTVSATDASGIASLACTDNGAPISLASVTASGTTTSGALNVSGTGTHNLVCTATDGAGNIGSASGTVKIDLTYTISLAPLKSPVTLGSAVPVTWQLKDAQGNIVSAPEVARDDGEVSSQRTRAGLPASARRQPSAGAV